MPKSKAEIEKIIFRSLSILNPEIILKPYFKKISIQKNITVLALGKAAWSMAKVSEELLGSRIKNGFVLTKYKHSKGLIKGFKIFEAGHPLPDKNSIIATKEIVDNLEKLGDRDHLIMLISGGASALLEMPKKGLYLDDLIKINQVLMHSGASIEEINTVRKRLSKVKGGGLAAIAEPASIEAYLLSDVLSNNPSVIASGPVFADQSNADKAFEVIEKYKIKISEAIARVIDIDNPRQKKAYNHFIIADNCNLLSSVANELKKSNFDIIIEPEKLTGEAAAEGRKFAKRLISLAKSRTHLEKPLILLAGGETVVKVTGDGKGGRCQEFALAAAKVIGGEETISICAIGSDGTDGPTDAAGAYIDEKTSKELKGKGLDIDEILSRNDSYPALDAIQSLIKTGPTETNVNDIYLGIIKPK